MKPNAEWTNDCQGKKDYDGDILTISTRYWPRGGGFGILNLQANRVSFENNPIQDIKPSATSSILFHCKADYIEIAEKHFEAETEKEVKTQVEKWVQKQFDDIVKLLKTKYKSINQ